MSEQEQPEALLYAGYLEANYSRCEDCQELKAAAELRRLHELNEHNYAMSVKWAKAFGKQSDRIEELLEALKLAVRQNDHDMLMTGEELRQCRAAIAKAQGESK